MWYQKYRQNALPFRHKAHVCQTDGRTERQNYDPQDRANIAASRGKKSTAVMHAVLWVMMSDWVWNCRTADTT